MEEAGAADGELVERGPSAKRGGGGVGVGEEIGDHRGDCLGAFYFPTNGANQRREFGANASQSSPVSRIVFELEENVENNVLGEL